MMHDMTNSSINQYKLSQFDLIRCFIIITLLTTNILFSGTTKGTYFSLAILLTTITTIISIILYPQRINRILNNKYKTKYIFWIFGVFVFYIIHYYLSPQYAELQILTVFNQGFCAILIILWIGDVDFNKSLYITVISTSIASVIISVYTINFFLSVNIFEIVERLGSDNSSSEIRNINFIAQSILFFSSFTLYYYYYEKNRNFIFFVVSIVQFSFILLSGSRRALLGYAVFFVVLVYLKNKRAIFKTIPIIVFMILGMLYIIMNNDVLYSIVGYRLEGLMNMIGLSDSNVIDRSTEIRADLFFAGLNMISQNPILGNGYAYFETHSIGFNAVYAVYHTHNNYLELFLNYGIIGFILYYYIFFKTYLKLTSKKDKSPLTYLFLTFFIILFVIIEPSSVTFSELPIYYFYLYLPYMYSKQNTFSRIIT